MLVRAVVVAGDGAGADVHPGAHPRVADVRKVAHLRPLADRRLLDLHEVPDPRVAPHHRPRPQPGEGAELCPRRHPTPLQVGVAAIHHPIRELGVAVDRVGADLAAAGDARGAVQADPRVEHRVRPHHHPRLHVGGGRVDQAHPRRQQGVVHPRPGVGGGGSEIGARVHPHHLRRPRVGERLHPQPLGHRHRHHVGEIELALGVVPREVRQGGAEEGEIEAIQAGVDLAKGKLRRARVLRLDDAQEAAAAVAHDPAQAASLGHLRGEQAHRRRVGLMVGDQADEFGTAHQGAVAAHHHHPAGRGRQRGEAAGDRVAGAKLRHLLHHHHRRHHRREVVHHPRRLVAHHRHQALGGEEAGGVEDVVHHRPAVDRMEDLGEGGLHPRPLAGGEKDHAGGHGWARLAGRKIGREGGGGGGSGGGESGTRGRPETDSAHRRDRHRGPAKAIRRAAPKRFLCLPRPPPPPARPVPRRSPPSSPPPPTSPTGGRRRWGRQGESRS